MKFTFRQLEYFATLRDHETLSSAAAALFISESTLSHAVSELERSVGVQLCHRRKGKGLTLTPAGRHFAERALVLIQEAKELALETTNVDGQLKGPVSLGCFSGVANNLVPAILEGLRRVHPGIEVDVVVGNDDKLLPALFAGKYDFVILYDMLLPPNLRRRTIYNTQVTAVMPAAHPLATGESVKLAELCHEPFILVDTKPSTDNTYAIFTDQGLIPQLSATVPSVELAKAVVGRGLGYTLLMSRPNSTNFTTEGRKIVSLPLNPPAGLTSVVAGWPKGTSLTPRALAVVDYAAGMLAG